MTELELISNLFNQWYLSFNQNNLNFNTSLLKIINLNFNYIDNIYSSEIIEKISIIKQEKLIRELNIKITHPFQNFRQLDEFNIKKILIIGQF